MATTKNLGIVSVVPADNWSSDVNYQKANFVRNNKATYMAKAANRNIEPGVSTNWQQYWMLCNYDGVAAAPTAIPLPDAETGAIGNSDSYAAANHVHPMSIVYESAQDALNKAVKTPILTGSAISAENTLNNAVTPFKVESKNLIPFPYYYGGAGDTYTSNGVTFTVNADGSVTANGTATGARSVFYLNSLYNIKLNQSSYLSGCPSGGSFSTYNIQIYNRSKYYFDIGNGVSIPSDDYIIVIVIVNGYTANNLTFYPQLEIGDTATAYTPYLPAETSVNITACGKNLIPFPYSGGSDFSLEGVTGTVNSDGSILLNGTTTAELDFYFFNNTSNNGTNYTKYIFKSGSYYLSPYINISYRDKDPTSSNKYLGNDATGKVVEWNENWYLGYIYLFIPPNTSFNNETIYPIIAYSDKQVQFDPYKSQSYSSAVGKTVDITQYDDVTNIFATTDGAAVSGQFILSTRYELDDKLTPLFGTFANRPTTTQPYTIMYIATDQTGENKVTILPPNTDGSVSGNWITI